jgi:hypothetical protein
MMSGVDVLIVVQRSGLRLGVGVVPTGSLWSPGAGKRAPAGRNIGAGDFQGIFVVLSVFALLGYGCVTKLG